MGIVLMGGQLLSADGLHKDYGVQIEQGIITRICPNEELQYKPDDTIYDLRDQLLMPGFVNGHNHMYGILSHGISAGDFVTDFKDFLNEFWWPYIENRVDKELVRITTGWACVEMIDSGITAFLDILEGPNSIPGALEVEKAVVKKAGLRGMLSFEACQRISEENGQDGIRENIEFAKACKEDELIKGLQCIHTLFTCDEEFIKAAKKKADQEGISFTLHLSESDYEPSWTQKNYKRLPVELYQEWGILDEHVIASQLVAVTDEEIEFLSKCNVHGVTMPLSNCEVGGGIAPVSKMLHKGMKVGLGTDGYINNFFEVCRGAFLIHKANEKSTQTMPAKTVFEMATRMGAEAIGLDTGVIMEGKPADIISVLLDTPTPINEKNVYDQIILYRNPSDIRNVFVNGQILKENGRIVTLNKEQCLVEMREVAAKFWNNQNTEINRVHKNGGVI